MIKQHQLIIATTTTTGLNIEIIYLCDAVWVVLSKISSSDCIRLLSLLDSFLGLCYSSCCWLLFILFWSGCCCCCCWCVQTTFLQCHSSSSSSSSSLALKRWPLPLMIRSAISLLLLPNLVFDGGQLSLWVYERVAGRRDLSGHDVDVTHRRTFHRLLWDKIKNICFCSNQNGGRRDSSFLLYCHPISHNQMGSINIFKQLSTFLQPDP